MTNNPTTPASTATFPSDQEVLDQQRDLWNTYAPGWERWDDVVSAALGPVGAAIVRSLDVQLDQHHLDVAAGTGEPGLSIAARAPRGRVTLTDLASGMLDVASRRAAVSGIDNIELEECSAEHLPYPDASFDSVSCRFGLMFVPDLATAAAELVRVIRPGGRLCAAVWAGADRNPWATIPGDAIATELDVPTPAPGAPGMFRCATPQTMVTLFERAGLGEVAEWDVPILLTLPAPEDYWRMLTEVTAPVVAAMARADEPQRARIRSKVVEAARTFVENGLVRLPGTARCVAGVKPTA